MKIPCPHCGKIVVVNSLGRKPLNIGVKNICDALRSCHGITMVAEKLGCSRGYIYKVLARDGLTPREVIQK